MSLKPKTAKGFSLAEVMIVLIIIGILASIGIPTYWQNVLQARRAEARAAIEEIRTLQYEYFQNYKTFGNQNELNNYPATTDGGHYQIAIAVQNAGLSFSATATAVNTQLKDTDCRVFSISSNNQLQAYDSSNNLTNNCW